MQKTTNNISFLVTMAMNQTTTLYIIDTFIIIAIPLIIDASVIRGKMTTRLRAQ